MRCQNCRYSLTGLNDPPHRCPECGRAFDPNDSGTFEAEDSTGFNFGAVALAVICAISSWGIALGGNFDVSSMVMAGAVALPAIWIAIVMVRSGPRGE